MIVMNASKNETDGRSLYRIIHDGDRDIKFDLLTASGLTLAEIPRYFLNADIDRNGWIRIRTRTGSGNDLCFCRDYMKYQYREAKKAGTLVKYKGKKHLSECWYMMNRMLEDKPNFIDGMFYYDVYDETFAYFHFMPLQGTEEIKRLFRLVQELYVGDDEPGKTFFKTLSDMDAIIKELPPEMLEKYPRITSLPVRIREYLKGAN